MKRKRSALSEATQSGFGAAAATAAAKVLGVPTGSTGSGSHSSAGQSKASESTWPDIDWSALPSDTEIVLNKLRSQFPPMVAVRSTSTLGETSSSHAGSCPVPPVLKTQLLSELSRGIVDKELSELGVAGRAQVCRLPLGEETAVLLVADLERYLTNLATRSTTTAAAATAAATDAAASSGGAAASSGGAQRQHAARPVLGPPGKRLAVTAGQRVVTAMVDLGATTADSAAAAAEHAAGRPAALLQAVAYFRALRRVHVEGGHGGSAAVSEQECAVAWRWYQQEQQQQQQGQAKDKDGDEDDVLVVSAAKRRRATEDRCSGSAGSTAAAASSSAAAATAAVAAADAAAALPPPPITIMRVLLSLGLLMCRHDVRGAGSGVGGYYFGVPECGRLVGWLRDGRADLLARLKRAHYGEITWETLSKARLPRSPMPPTWHAADLMGSGLAVRVFTAAGPFLRLASSAGAPEAAAAALVAAGGAGGSSRAAPRAAALNSFSAPRRG